MRWIRLVLPAVVLIGSALPAQAQIFTRKPRLAMEVPELIVTAKTDPDERRRAAAVEQLRDSDIRAYPDITGVLIDRMLNDTKPNVRLEAVHSLSKVRPMSQLIGQAMQQAALNDENWRVRFQAKTAMWMMGYRGEAREATTAAPVGITYQEPPLANNPMTIASPGPRVPPLPMPSVPVQGIQVKVPGTTPNTLPANPPIEIVPDASNRQLPSSMSVSTPRPLPIAPPPPVPVPAQGIQVKVPATTPNTPPVSPPIEVVPDSSNRQLPPGMTVSMPRPAPVRPGFSTAMPLQPSPIQVTGPPPPLDLPPRRLPKLAAGVAIAEEPAHEVSGLLPRGRLLRAWLFFKEAQRYAENQIGSQQVPDHS